MLGRGREDRSVELLGRGEAPLAVELRRDLKLPGRFDAACS
jgi:hypothetical protein